MKNGNNFVAKFVVSCLAWPEEAHAHVYKPERIGSLNVVNVNANLNSELTRRNTYDTYDVVKTADLN